MRSIYMDEKIERYIVDLVFATNPELWVEPSEKPHRRGASPRASIGLGMASKATRS